MRVGLKTLLASLTRPINFVCILDVWHKFFELDRSNLKWSFRWCCLTDELTFRVFSKNWKHRMVIIAWTENSTAQKHISCRFFRDAPHDYSQIRAKSFGLILKGCRVLGYSAHCWSKWDFAPRSPEKNHQRFRFLKCGFNQALAWIWIWLNPDPDSAARSGLFKFLLTQLGFLAKPGLLCFVWSWT